MRSIERDNERFSRLANEPMPIIPHGYTAPLEFRFIRQLIADRQAKRPIE